MHMLLPRFAFLGSKARNSFALPHRRHRLTAASQRVPADLIEWPLNSRPSSGNVTRSTLTKLKVAVLRRELDKRGIPSTGKKKELVEVLLEAVLDEFGKGSEDDTNGAAEGALGRSQIQPEEQSSIGVSNDGSGDFMFIESIDESCPDIVVGGMAKIPQSMDWSSKVDFLQTNKAGMQLVFLGTSSGCATPQRGLPSMAFCTQADIWLFDVGEDTQRQILKHPCMKPSKITRIFVTGLSPDLLHGIPGMICTISCSRQQGHSSADTPFHIYGPSGLASYVDTLLAVSETYVEVPIIVHEFTAGSIVDTFHQEMVSHSRRGIWKSLIPPDTLNPAGWYDAELNSVMPVNRVETIKTGKRFRANKVNSRSQFRKHRLPDPGDPSRAPVAMSEITWTLRMNEQFKIVVIPLKSSIPSIAYYVEEADRAGKLYVERALQLGISNTKSYSKLKQGSAVLNKHGRSIASNCVVSPDYTGRRILIMGKTNDPDRTIKNTLVDNPDVVVMPVTRNPTSQPREMLVHKDACAFANNLAAGQVLFSQIEQSDPCQDVKELESLPGEPGDLYTHIVESRQPPPLAPLTNELLEQCGC